MHISVYNLYIYTHISVYIGWLPAVLYGFAILLVFCLLPRRTASRHWQEILETPGPSNSGAGGVLEQLLGPLVASPFESSPNTPSTPELTTGFKMETSPS